MAPDLNISNVSALNCSTLSKLSVTFSLSSFMIRDATAVLILSGVACVQSDSALSADEGAGDMLGLFIRKCNKKYFNVTE